MHTAVVRNLYLVNRATNVFSLEDLQKGSQPLGGYSRWGFPLRNGLVLVEWFDVDAPMNRIGFPTGLVCISALASAARASLHAARIAYACG